MNILNHLILLAAAAIAVPALAHDEDGAPALVHSQPGSNIWNAGAAPADWQAEIRRYHGHVGPWNVLGWRMAQVALREFKTEWGRHDLEIICHLPADTPFTCLIDGVSVGSGNSQGRLDLRLSEVLVWQECFVAVRRKDGKGGVIELRPRLAYLKSIMGQSEDKLDALCKECASLPEDKLFEIKKIEQ